MRNKALPILTAIVVLFIFSCQSHRSEDQPIKKEKRVNGRMTDFLASLEYEFEMVKNPKTGKIPEGIRDLELKQAREIYSRQPKVNAENFYTFQGPNNLGGRTRTIVYDIRYNGTSNQTILAGGVSGGVFKSTDNGSTWIRKSAPGDHFSCTSIAQDTRPGFENIWYYATGESQGNSAGATSAFYSGNGIYKSVDNGETWTRLASSNTSLLETFSTGADMITKVLVNPLNGDVYFACLAAIMRSQDGGLTWSAVLNGVLSNSAQVTDVIISSTGQLYASFSGTNSNTVDGVWTSATGNSGSWTRIAGTGVATDPAGWNAQNNYGRIVLALAPSNENILYILYYNNQGYPNLEAEFYKYDASTETWSDRSSNLPDEAGGSSGNDPFAVQGGYDLVVKVKPDDENVVFIGGTNLYRSTDGFATTTNTTRIGGYANSSSYAMYTNSHPDIHEIVFQPGSSTIMICGNDGGMQRTSDYMAATVSWSPINTGFRTFQYYYVAIDPRTGNNKVLGGAQDNGSTRNIGGAGTDMEMVMSGDGVSVGLSNEIAGQTYEYVGWQFGQIIRRNALAGSGFGTEIRPAAATANGLFVTLFHLDPDNTENLYYANHNSLYRNTNASTATTGNWTSMSGIASAVTASFNITSIATTRGTYNASTASMFLGTSNGRVLRLDDPQNAAAATATVDISSGLPMGYVSSISVNPRNDDTVLVTLSNYGINNIWWTGNANAATPTWQNVEGNLTLPSVRSSAIAITADGIEYFAGTSMGLFKTIINGASPATTIWTQEGSSEIGNAVVTSLALRPADNRLLVGTHGYGMWSTSLTLTTLPVSLLEFNGNIQRQTVLLNWKASHTTAEGGFEIEKSEDGINFRKIGVVGFKHTSTADYSFTDNEAYFSNNYYRLRMYEVGVSAKYSDVLLFRNGSAQDVFVTNPVRNSLEIKFAKLPSLIKLSVTDASGRLLFNEQFHNPASPRITINELNRIQPGVYFLNAEVDGKIFSRKIIKQ